MSGNNGSYQKYDGSSGTYQEVNDTTSSTKKSSWKTWIIGSVLVAVLAVGYTYSNNQSFFHNTPNDVVQKSMAASSGVTVDKTGKLKLFDELSTYYI